MIDIPNGVTPSSSHTAKREPLQETLDRVELVDPRMSDISHVEREAAALIQSGTQGFYRRRPHAVQFAEVGFGDLRQLV